MVSLFSIFKVFAKIGGFTIGGGYAMIPIIQDELDKRGWISETEFQDIVALCQSAPGILAVNMSIFAGYRLRGVKGSIVACIGTILPPFISILLIAMLFTTYADNPVVIRIFSGIRPVVISLIAVPMIKMARRNNKTWWAWAISAISLVLVAFVNVSPIYILMVIIVLAVAFTMWKERRRAPGNE
ncbi:MAG: chromate transporter [Bacteroidales bacterium]|nr:chromate transporter [Bacteroidales bacterium]